MPRLRNRAGLRVPQRLRDEEVLEDGPERNEEEENQFDHLPDEIDLIELELVANKFHGKSSCSTLEKLYQKNNNEFRFYGFELVYLA